MKKIIVILGVIVFALTVFSKTDNLNSVESKLNLTNLLAINYANAETSGGSCYCYNVAAYTTTRSWTGAEGKTCTETCYVAAETVCVGTAPNCKSSGGGRSCSTSCE